MPLFSSPNNSLPNSPVAASNIVVIIITNGIDSLIIETIEMLLKEEQETNPHL